MFAKIKPFILHSASFVILLVTLLASPIVSAGYVALNGGVATLDYDQNGYESEDTKAEAYELTVGWDLSHRFSLEMSWSDLGDFDYRRSDGRVSDISVVSYRVNGVYYLFSTNGFNGLKDRSGFSGFLKFGGGGLDTTRIFSDLGRDLDGTYLSLGLGAEVAVNPNTYFRFQVHTFGDSLAFGSVAIMWRWGHRR